jgi:glutamine synthetase
LPAATSIFNIPYPVLAGKLPAEETMDVADKAQLEAFLQSHPQIEMIELLMPDINGFLRCKRIQRREFDGLFSQSFKVPITVPFLGTMGDLYDGLDESLVAGDPDQLLLPVSGSLAPIPWLNSPTAQVLTTFATMDGTPLWADPRNVLAGVVERFHSQGLKPVVATELEFYLLADSDEAIPRPLTGKVVGTNLRQQGIQYCMPEDLWECDDFLNDVREACELQNVPLTAIHSEFSAGQWEINTHHADDPVLACDHAVLLKRIVKGVARRHGIAACFMAKPFSEGAGSGMHIHSSVYDDKGDNIFSDSNSEGSPTAATTLRHAVGGMAAMLAESMAILAPNANSYRRFTPGAYAPVSPTWGYNHRDVALRIPVSSDSNRRIEHRVAGADANPYLVMAAVLASIHHGISEQCEPGPETPTGTELSSREVLIPNRWDKALECFRQSSVMPAYLGEDFCKAFATIRQGECDDFHSRVSDIDYAWYLRAV